MAITLLGYSGPKPPIRWLRMQLSSQCHRDLSGICLDHPGFKARRHHRAQFLARPDERLLPRAAADERLARRAPAQAGDDRLDPALRAGAVMTGADVGRIGLALGQVQTRIIDAIEEIF